MNTLTIRIAALMLRLHEANADAISDALERDGSASRITKNSAAFIIAETQRAIAWQLYNILAESGVLDDQASSKNEKKTTGGASPTAA